MAERKPDQSVDAFSAPKSLLRAAQLEAKRRRMSKSAFYRYCLAKEVGYTDAQANELTGHAGTGVFNVIEDEQSARVAEDSPNPKPKKPKP
jgi:hypothetical protein